MSEGNLVRYALSGNVATITLNRPKAMNAMNIAMFDELRDAVNRFSADQQARVAILNGEGRAFCTGGDLSESLGLVTSEPASLYQLPKQGIATMALITESDKPIIAAVHGYCMAGGLMLAHACHLIVAGASTQFGMPETKVGMPTMGYLDLWKVIGPRRFTEMVLTGENFGTDKALECGFINRIVDDESVMEETIKLAQTIAANSPLSITGHLEAIRLSVRHDKSTLEDLQNWIWDKVVFSEDLQEGLSAFQDRRPPQWKGK